jgi:hypothetical protein
MEPVETLGLINAQHQDELCYANLNCLADFASMVIGPAVTDQ